MSVTNFAAEKYKNHFMYVYITVIVRQSSDAFEHRVYLHTFNYSAYIYSINCC